MADRREVVFHAALLAGVALVGTVFGAACWSVVHLTAEHVTIGWK